MIIQDPGNFTGFESQSQQEFYYSLLASLGFPSKISTVSPLVGMGSFSVASGSSSFFDIGNAGFGAIPSGSLGSYVQNNLFVGSLSLSLITIGWTSAGNSVAQLALLLITNFGRKIWRLLNLRLQVKTAIFINGLVLLLILFICLSRVQV
jgi:hypothetical protein